MLLRITDVLLRNLIWAAVEKDGQDIMSKKTESVDLLIETITNCGITFNVRKLNNVHVHVTID